MDLSDNAAHILIVDDDQRIRDRLAQYLFACLGSGSGRTMELRADLLSVY
jgi:hypothetical protein